MEAAGNDDGDDGDDGGHGRRLRQCNLCKFIGKCLAIFLRFLARHFLLCHNFLPASFCILFVHIWRLLQFIFNFIVCCKPRGKGGRKKKYSSREIIEMSVGVGAGAWRLFDMQVILAQFLACGRVLVQEVEGGRSKDKAQSAKENSSGKSTCGLLCMWMWV